MKHWKAIKVLLRYIKGIVDTGLEFGKFTDYVNIVGYSDADFAKDLEFRKSTTCYIVTVCGFCVSWKLILQSDIALSTTQSEYIALTEYIKEVLWIQGLLSEIKLIDKTPVIYIDSQGTYNIARDPIFNDKTKYIGVNYLIRLNILNANVQVEQISTNKNPTNMSTKTVVARKMLFCRSFL